MSQHQTALKDCNVVTYVIKSATEMALEIKCKCQVGREEIKAIAERLKSGTSDIPPFTGWPELDKIMEPLKHDSLLVTVYGEDPAIDLKVVAEAAEDMVKGDA